jgi:hypothetical protein
VIEELQSVNTEALDLENGTVIITGSANSRQVFFHWKLGQDDIEEWSESHNSERQPISTLK